MTSPTADASKQTYEISTLEEKDLNKNALENVEA